MYGEISTSNVSISNDSMMSALATIAMKSSHGKFTAKIDFPIGYFMLTIADVDIDSKKSLYTLFDTYLDHTVVKFEQICMVQN